MLLSKTPLLWVSVPLYSLVVFGCEHAAGVCAHACAFFIIVFVCSVLLQKERCVSALFLAALSRILVNFPLPLAYKNGTERHNGRSINTFVHTSPIQNQQVGQFFTQINLNNRCLLQKGMQLIDAIKTHHKSN